MVVKQPVTMLLCVLAMAVSGCHPTPPISREGLDAFWAIQEDLTLDREVPKERWNALFDSPGYAQLDRVENRSAWMPEVFEHAYRPSLAQAERDWGPLGPMVPEMLIPHLRQAAERRAEIDDYADEFARARTVDLALERTRRWLPTGAAPSDGVPPTFLVMVDGDGKALPDSVVIDAYGLYAMHDRVGFLAHEFHHIFRHDLLVPLEGLVPPEHEPMVRLLSQIEEEGVANLIDKRRFVIDGQPLPEHTMQHPMLGWVWPRFFQAAESADDSIAAIDAALSAVARGDGDASRIVEGVARAHPSFSRHAVGLVMASRIVDELGAERVIDTVGDPFAFALAYAEAARRARGRGEVLAGFSAESVGLLERWGGGAWRADDARQDQEAPADE